MKKTLALLGATAALLSPLPAVPEGAPDNAETRALVVALMEALHTREAFDQHVQTVVLGHIQRQPEIVSYRDVLTDFYSKYVGFEGLQEPLIEMYIANFSQEELRELTAFYRSSAGQKSLTILPTIAGAALEAGVKRASLNNDELQGMIDAKAEILNME